MLNKILKEIKLIKQYGLGMQKTKSLIENAYNIEFSTFDFWKIYTGRIRCGK